MSAGFSMKIEGRETLKSETSLVWEALEGTEAYTVCLPAITKLGKVSPNRREVTIDFELPAISSSFEGSIDVLERDEHQCMQLRIQRMRLSLDGVGEAGVISGKAEIF